MPKTQKQQLGVKGEEAAAEFLKSKGHLIAARNFRFQKSELDIISLIDDVLVISEVKSFQKMPLGAAEYRVDKRKQRQIILGAYGFLSENPEFENRAVRFDVIVVNFSEYPAQVIQHEGAFWDEQGW